VGLLEVLLVLRLGLVISWTPDTLRLPRLIYAVSAPLVMPFDLLLPGSGALIQDELSPLLAMAVLAALAAGLVRAMGGAPRISP